MAQDRLTTNGGDGGRGDSCVREDDGLGAEGRGGG